MSRRYPRIGFEVISNTASTLQRELKARNVEVHVAILEDSFNEEDFNAEILYDDPLFVVADAHHPLGRRRNTKLAELVNEPWALPPADSPSGEYIRKAFQEGGLALPQRVVSTYSHVLRHHLVATAGFVTVLPKSMLQVMATSLCLRALPVRMPEKQRTMAVVTLKQRTLSPIAKLFIDSLRAVAKPGTIAKKGHA
jgi:DNA-binding transcriptional LysR family regulator